MKAVYKKEIFWLIGCAIAALIFSLLYYSRFDLDINQHDTYYKDIAGSNSISAPTNVFWILISSLLFIVYLLRAIVTRFGNNAILYPLSLSAFGIIWWFNSLLQIQFAMFYEIEMAKLKYNSPGSTTGLFYGGGFSSDDYLLINTIKYVLILFIALVSFMIGRNSTKTKVDLF